tara:strand:- start:3 stop:242 length:240 start_codon:yes stop_codon:yes gene_type:complete
MSVGFVIGNALSNVNPRLDNKFLISDSAVISNLSKNAASLRSVAEEHDARQGVTTLAFTSEEIIEIKPSLVNVGALFAK